MDVTALVQACIEGIASGGFQILGTALASSTLGIFRRILPLKKQHSTQDEQQLQDLLPLMDSTSLAARINKLAESDERFRELLDDWTKQMEDFIQKNATQSPHMSNTITGNITNSTVTQSNTIK
ncbi:hypothetical protein CPA40_09220 [Bifidobacterium callitrichos]|uniref:Uncharacterized protein n=1 Tax=Bifidobacterium callitrichos TaxID=762209 RepID=A0A2T3G8P3_9BIFI|nr:hypothetical protein [Bifidobacterium callitrichos]PST45781.1 hypothetical protein CPA40_09220 [Bifidobacterium callitrichos]